MNNRKKKVTNWVRIRSKNHTADMLRKAIPTDGKNVILRLGSKTPTIQITTKRIDLELNSPEACIVSNNKILMKEKFAEAGVPTAEWAILSQNIVDSWEYYPAIIKHIHSSKGEGIYYIENAEQLKEFAAENVQNLSKHIIEKYYTYTREYRLHVTKDGCFYACRKMLKRDAEVRWHRHDSNCVWIVEDNPEFNKPDNWDDIVNDCVKAMQSVGLDICAIDIKMQGGGNNNPAYIILETNSAPSLGELGAEKYIEFLTNLVKTI